MAKAATEGDLFWRRFLAGALDLALLVALGSLISAAAYSASGGAVRGSTMVAVTRCWTVTALPESLMRQVRPAGAAFQPDAAALCAKSFLGAEVDRVLVLTQHPPAPAAARTLEVPLDAAGRLLKPFRLNLVLPFLLLAAMALAEATTGRTAGKALLGLEVAAAEGGRLPLHRALLRNLVILGGVALVAALPAAAASVGVKLPVWGYLATVAVCALLAWTPLALMAQAKPQARYDRWARAVVRAT